jgi:hypothetical protein
MSEQQTWIRRVCHYCRLPLNNDEKAMESNNTPGVWAHFTCWYDGRPFEHDMMTPRQHEIAKAVKR